MRRLVLLLSILVVFTCGSFNGSDTCVPISGTEGKVYDALSHDSVAYTMEMKGGGYLRNLGDEPWCGYEFPGVDAPWTGNTNETSIVTYTFDRPVYTIDVMIGYVGVRGEKARESFTFNVDKKLPYVTVDHGSCEAWEIHDNKIISPDVAGAFVGIAKIASKIPFRQLIITSGENSQSNGGSSYALCSSSCRARPLCSTPFVVPPKPGDGN